MPDDTGGVEYNPHKKKIAADCFRKANEAIPKGNWDYAVEMYTQSVRLIPDNLMYRQSLRGAEQKMYGNNGTGAKMAGMRLMGVRGKIKKARMSKNWADLEKAAEEGLAVNPWDPQLNADLGDACRELGYQEVAVMSYRESLKVEPGNKEVNTVLAALLEERGEYKDAVECWQRVLKADPHNGTARTKITALEAKSVMDRGGYEAAESTRGVMADHEVARRLGKTKAGEQADGPGMSVEADLQRAIRKDPANRDNYLKLADLYKRDNDLHKSEEQYRKALEVSGGDINIRELHEDVQLDLMRQALQIAKELAQQATDDPAAKQKPAEMAKELMLREIEVLSARVDRYPADMKIKLQLASLFMRTRKWQAAIPLLQVARGDSRIKGDALVALGKCFVYDGKPQLARRQLESAVPEVSFEAQPDLFKDLLYTLGKLCEETKDATAAEDYYQRVLEVDYNYKDALDRLNRLQSGEATSA